jgi:hypothetical protein
MKALTRIALSLSFGASLVQAQFSPGNPLAGLEKLKDFQSMRASSSDADWKNGNSDARPIAPGGTLILAELEGPGVIASTFPTRLLLPNPCAWK